MEILLFILQAIFDIFSDVLLQIIAQLLFESIVWLLENSVSESINRLLGKPHHPALAAGGYILIGSITGAISLALFPHSFAHRESFRVLTLIAAPIFSAAFFTWIGHIRKRKGKPIVALDMFGYTYAFSLGVALVRFGFAT